MLFRSTSPREMIMRSIADNIVLVLQRSVAEPSDRAIAAMNVAAVMSRHAGLNQQETVDLLKCCMAADKKATINRKEGQA